MSMQVTREAKDACFCLGRRVSPDPWMVDEFREEYAACFSLPNLMDAAKKCASEVSWKHSVLNFMLDQLINCARLDDEINTGTHQIRETKSFSLTERGKRRTVNSTAIDDRVLQRCFCDQVLVPAIRGVIVEGNSACLKGRGLSHAIEIMRDIILGADFDWWFLQFDFHDYFHSINREILVREFAEIIDNPLFVRFIWDVLSNTSDPEIKERGVGVELGSEVSQLGGVFYPNGMDWDFQNHFAGYERYMDDGFVVCETKDDAKRALDMLHKWAQRLGLTINEKKTHINRITHPIVFCKIRFRKTRRGVSTNVRKEQTRRSIKHLASVRRLHDAGIVENFESPYAAVEGYINRGDDDLSRLLNGIKPPQKQEVDPDEVFDILDASCEDIPTFGWAPYDPAYKYHW